VSQSKMYKLLFKEHPDVMDVQQISRLLGVSTKTVYKLLRDGSLPSLKVGREFRVTKVAVIRYVNQTGHEIVSAKV
jgi:excisionase family DNA binding protein